MERRDNYKKSSGWRGEWRGWRGWREWMDWRSFSLGLILGMFSTTQ
jgi:hypothetical protein